MMCHVTHIECLCVDVNTKLSQAINRFDLEINNYRNQRRDKCYEEIQHISDFDVKMMANTSMESDIVQKIISGGKSIISTYRKLEHTINQISKRLYNHFLSLIEMDYTELCISTTEKNATDIISSIIHHIHSLIEILMEYCIGTSSKNK